MTDKLSDKRFEEYYELLIRRNNEFNLTAITQRDDVWLKHFEDSLAAAPFIKNDASLLDVGSGAGFPGIPLKLVRDDIRLTMVESIRKKAEFLKEATALLRLDKTEVINKRAEDLSKAVLYDYGTARAVAKISALSEYILPFLKVGGVMIAYKGKDAEEEVAASANALKILGAKVLDIKKFTLGADIERSLVLIEKISETPAKYPRGGNRARVSPL